MILTDQQLKNLILESGLAKEKDVDALINLAKSSSLSFYDLIIDKNIASDELLGQKIALFLGLPFVILSKTQIPDDVFHITPEKIARKFKVIAFGRDENGLKLAMSDPRNKQIAEMIGKKTGENVVVYYATQEDIRNTLRIYRKDLQTTCDNLLNEEFQGSVSIVFDEAPIAKIIDLIINYAYQDQASDIHIEPEEKHSLVRFRIDGMLHDVLRLPKNLHDRIITRIKVLSRLRTDEHLSAQDGKMRMNLAEENLDIRVSIVPVADGEKGVLRLLASKQKQFSLGNLGISSPDLKKIMAAMNKSYGMILSTGPTGSGKTTIIYTILKQINIRERNITTIEDPVEYRITGANQIQVNTKTNLTFANGLRSILRQDPNVIFVGEIRDNETAGIAVDAALTGHLVLSTLHTNDAATAIPRLIDMQVEPFLVASTVNIIIAQRLVRKICEMCKTTITMTQNDLIKNLPIETVLKHFGDSQEINIYKGLGCKICHFTGYQGRLGVFEVLEVTSNIRKLIAEKSDADVILRQAVKEGMSTMMDDGLDKVARGLTSLEEVLRATKTDKS